jgi:hypothetical protein
LPTEWAHARTITLEVARSINWTIVLGILGY